MGVKDLMGIREGLGKEGKTPRTGVAGGDVEPPRVPRSSNPTLGSQASCSALGEYVNTLR